MRLSGSVEMRELERLFSQLSNNTRFTSPLMRALSGNMLDAVEENFEKEGRPQKWAKLSEVTMDRRQAIGKANTKILQQSGDFATSMHKSFTLSTAIVGTNDPKAATHVFGARQGQYGRTKRNGPIPWGNVPKRNPLMFTVDDLNQFTKTTLNFMLKSGIDV